MLSKEEIWENHLKKDIGWTEAAMLAMDEYANLKIDSQFEEKVDWLYKNINSVKGYSVSKEVADYIRATHHHATLDFYLLPSGDWVKLIEEEHTTTDAIAFAEWLSWEGYRQYDGYDRWISPENGNDVYETPELYEMFLKDKNRKQ